MSVTQPMPNPPPSQGEVPKITHTQSPSEVGKPTKSITIKTPFTLTRNDGTTRRFATAGRYDDVTEEDAEHFFVKAHTVGSPSAAPTAPTTGETDSLAGQGEPIAQQTPVGPGASSPAAGTPVLQNSPDADAAIKAAEEQMSKAEPAKLDVASDQPATADKAAQAKQAVQAGVEAGKAQEAEEEPQPVAPRPTARRAAP